MSSQVFTQSAEALGTTVILQLVTDAQPEADELFGGLWRQVEEFESRFSRFLPTSELTLVNQGAGERVIVSQDFCNLTGRAKELATATHGSFNPFVLPAVQRAGYVMSLHERTSSQPALDYQDRDIVAVDSLEVGHGWVKIPHNGALDFGGIGKGYLADQLAKACAHLDGYCLSIGGDMAVGGQPTDKKGWQIAIEDAHDRETNRAVVHCTKPRYGVATSGQKRLRGGREVSHAVDTKKGGLTDSIFTSATVVAANATEADVYAGVAIQASGAELERLCKNGTLYAVMRQQKDGAIEVFGREYIELFEAEQ